MQAQNQKESEVRPKSAFHALKRLLEILLRNRYAMLIVILILVIVALVLGGRTTSHTTSRMVQFGLRDVGKLTTQAGYFTNVQVIENSKELFGLKVPLTTTKCIFSYDGTVNAGIDFSEIQIDISELKKEITVTLPETQIFNVEVDPNSMEIYDESKSIFTPLSLNDVNGSMENLHENVRNQAIENGILEAAAANAKLLIQNMLGSYIDTTDYEIIIV